MVRWGALPDHNGDERLDIGNAHDIDIGQGVARLRRAVLVTLDGIAKGFAVDRAVAALVRYGASSGWVNAGGDLRIFGDRRLKIAQRQLDGSLKAMGYLENAAMASSFIGGDAMQELPARVVGAVSEDDGGNSVVSVMAKSTWRADALTKVAGVAPAADRRKLVSQLGGTLVAAGPR
jgi:thiamine biosynthesis lipoprotein